MTTPTIPGLVVTVPAGTTIVGPDGNPVSQITITPVPVDRSPMPFPAGVTASMLFTIQPGGAVPSQPLPITFPNVRNAPPGSQADLYFFDLSIGGWAVWGTGTVSDDGSVIVSNPGFGLPRFAWHYPYTPNSGDLPDQCQETDACCCDPVDLVTGRFILKKTDLVLPGRIPVSIQRHYRSENTRVGLFGIGWNLAPYDVRLTTSGTSLMLIQPNQSQYLLAPAGPGQWANATAPFLRGAVATQLPGDFIYQIRFKGGTVYRFERIFGFSNLAALSAITDRNGNTITLTRDQVFQQNRITRIAEPAGRAIRLDYDEAGRITSLTDPCSISMFSPVPAVAAGCASSPPSRTGPWPAPSSLTSAARSPPRGPALPHPHLPRSPSPTAPTGCSFAEPPPGAHTPSSTARPGGSKIASTQRAPAGGSVAVSPR